MTEALSELDQKAFILLNGLHAPWVDTMMVYVSMTATWIPLHIIIVYYIFKYHKDRAWIVLLCVGVCILMADQITSSLMKPLFSRLRPSWDPQLSTSVHVVNGYKGGKFGFPSSHAANTFGTVTLLCFIYKRSWMPWLFIWAVFVSYSRIYLGVHYPSDVLAGGLIGAACGWLAYKLYGVIVRYTQKGQAEN